MITTVDIFRTQVQPQEEQDEADSGTDDDVRDVLELRIFGTVPPPGEEPARTRLSVFGDLQVIQDGWFIGVTGVVRLDFRGSQVPRVTSQAEADEAVLIYGPWVAHVLYDVVAAKARALAVQSFTMDMDIPVLTPDYEIVQLAESEPD